jgi:hypothetical protein
MFEYAARAAALAPTGANPIALAQKVLADSAQEKLAKPVATTNGDGRGAEATTAASPVSIPVRTTQTGRGKAETGIAVANEPPLQQLWSALLELQMRNDQPHGPLGRAGRIVIVNC